MGDIRGLGGGGDHDTFDDLEDLGVDFSFRGESNRTVDVRNGPRGDGCRGQTWSPRTDRGRGIEQSLEGSILAMGIESSMAVGAGPTRAVVRGPSRSVGAGLTRVMVSGGSNRGGSSRSVGVGTPGSW